MNSKVLLIKHDVSVLCEYLSQKLSINLVPDNINNPTAEIVQTICYNFLKQAVDVPDYSITTLPLAVDVDIDHELHRKSIPLVLVYHTLKSFVKDTTDGKILLSMCDFASPQKDVLKLKRVLSFFVDFLKFLEVMNPMIDGAIEELNEKREQLAIIQQESVVVENRKNELVAHTAARKRREVELSNEVHKVNEELQSIVKKYQAVNEAKAETSKKIEETNLEKHRLEAETEILKKTAEHMSGELMSSPDRAKNEMSAKKKQITEIEAIIEETKRSLQKRKRALDIYSDAQKMISYINEKSKTLCVEKQRFQSLLDQLTNEERKMEELEQQYAFSCDQTNSTGEIMKEIAENHSKLRQEHLERISSLQKDLEHVKKDFEVRKSQPGVSEDIDKKNSELVAVRHSISDLNRKSVHESAELIAAFEKIAFEVESQRNQGENHIRAVDRVTSRLTNSIDGKKNVDITFSTTTLMDITNSEEKENDVSTINIFK